MSGRPLCENGHCMIDSGARHKAYEPIDTTRRLAHTRLLTTSEPCFHPTTTEERSVARIEAPSGARVGFGSASIAVERSFNGDSRRKSQVKDKVCKPPPRHCARRRLA